MLEETVGVVVFALRRTAAHHTELLLRRETGAREEAWSALSGAIQPEEREADAALRELFEQTALRPSRLYAAPFSGRNDDTGRGPVGRMGIFVAYVDTDAKLPSRPEGFELDWCRVREAGPKLHRDQERSALERMLMDFVRRPPDESLRVL